MDDHRTYNIPMRGRVLVSLEDNYLIVPLVNDQEQDHLISVQITHSYM